MGNFCGDYVKGKLDSEHKKSLPENFLKGVRLHRFIDHFTDTDETVRIVVAELRYLYHRAAPVAADICFDHFLAKHYSKFYATGLRQFVSEFYGKMTLNDHLIPQEMRPLAYALKENDWLYKYREWETVERTFSSMGRRFSFLKDLAVDNRPDNSELEEMKILFFEFYPRLMEATATFLEELQVDDGSSSEY